MADYDHMPSADLPYVMFMQAPNYATPSVNTDSFGLRYSTGPDGQQFGLKDLENRSVNLFVGGSTAFGVGASHDSHSISSRLSGVTGEYWLNIAGRAFSGKQELILFQSLLSHLGDIKKIVLFSGINDLTLHYLTPDVPKPYGGFFHWTTFRRAMALAGLTKNRRRLATVLHPLTGDQVDFSRISAHQIPGAVFKSLFSANNESVVSWKEQAERQTQRKDDLLPLVRNNLRTWKLLADGLGVELYFVLQPIYNWIDKPQCNEETKLFAELDGYIHNQYKVLKEVLNRDMHDWYARNLEAICIDLKIDYSDMSMMMSGRYGEKDWIFVDRAHFTDAGYGIVAEKILEIVSSRTG